MNTKIQRLYCKRFAQIGPFDLPQDIQVVYDNMSENRSKEPEHEQQPEPKIEELPDGYNNKCSLVEPYLQIYRDTIDWIYCEPIDTKDAALEINQLGECVLYINIHDTLLKDHHDNDLGLFFNDGIFVGFGTTSGVAFHTSIADAADYVVKFHNKYVADWESVLSEALRIARPDELGLKVDADINCVDELDDSLDTNELSMQNEFPAGEGDSNQSTRPGLNKISSKDVHPGAILALIPTDEAREQIAAGLGDQLHEDPEDLHITLCYLGKNLSDEDIEKVQACLDSLCPEYSPLECRMQGLGVFDHEDDGGRPFYASIDAVGMAKLRTDLIEAIEASGVKMEHKYDFTPHMTLGYIDPDQIEISNGSPGVEWTSNCVVLMNKGEHTEFKLGSLDKEAQGIPEQQVEVDQLLQTMPQQNPATQQMENVKIEENPETIVRPPLKINRQIIRDLIERELAHIRAGDDDVAGISSSDPFLSEFADSAMGWYLERSNMYDDSQVDNDGMPFIHLMAYYKRDADVLFEDRFDTFNVDAATDTLINSVYSWAEDTINNTPNDYHDWRFDLASRILNGRDGFWELTGQFVTGPIANRIRPQIGQELHKILHIASKEAGGFGNSMHEINSPGTGGNFTQQDHQLSDDTQEGPDLKLGDVEEEYSSGGGPLGTRFDDKDYNPILYKDQTKESVGLMDSPVDENINGPGLGRQDLSIPRGNKLTFGR